MVPCADFYIVYFLPEGQQPLTVHTLLDHVRIVTSDTILRTFLPNLFVACDKWVLQIPKPKLFITDHVVQQMTPTMQGGLVCIVPFFKDCDCYKALKAGHTVCQMWMAACPAPSPPKHVRAILGNPHTKMSGTCTRQATTGEVRFTFNAPAGMPSPDFYLIYFLTPNEADITLNNNNFNQYTIDTFNASEVNSFQQSWFNTGTNKRLLRINVQQPPLRCLIFTESVVDQINPLMHEDDDRGTIAVRAVQQCGSDDWGFSASEEAIWPVEPPVCEAPNPPSNVSASSINAVQFQ